MKMKIFLLTIALGLGLLFSEKAEAFFGLDVGPVSVGVGDPYYDDFGDYGYDYPYYSRHYGYRHW